MELKVDKKSDITVIGIIGDLDGSSAETAQKEISEQITPGCSLIFNMEKCTFISSAGLRVLLMSAKHIKRENGKGALSIAFSVRFLRKWGENNMCRKKRFVNIKGVFVVSFKSNAFQ